MDEVLERMSLKERCRFLLLLPEQERRRLIDALPERERRVVLERMYPAPKQSWQGGKMFAGSKEIVPVLWDHREFDQLYVEPFMGGFNVGWEMDNPRICSDINPLPVAFWQEVQAGWLPPEKPSKSTYEWYKKRFKAEEKQAAIRRLSRRQKAMLCWIGYSCSYMGHWFNGWAEILGGTGQVRRQARRTEGVKFQCCHYEKYNATEGALIYLDPPYIDTKKYAGPVPRDFDNQALLDWAARMARDNTVFLSEMTLPPIKYRERYWRYKRPARNEGKRVFEYLVKVAAL